MDVIIDNIPSLSVAVQTKTANGVDGWAGLA